MGGFPFALFCKYDFANDLVLLKKHWNMHQFNARSLQSSILFSQHCVPYRVANTRRHLLLQFNALKIYLICPTLSTRNSSTAMRHTALLLGTFAFNTVFCKERQREEEGLCVKSKSTNHEGPHSKAEWAPTLEASFNVCGFPGTAGAVGLSPHTADPPAAS